MKPAELKKRRIQMRLSQAKLGRVLGKCSRTIIRYEQGKIKIPLVVELALDSLGSLALSGGVAPKTRPISKRWNTKVATLRSFQARRLHVHLDGKQPHGKTYMPWLRISLVLSPGSHDRWNAELTQFPACA